MQDGADQNSKLQASKQQSTNKWAMQQWFATWHKMWTVNMSNRWVDPCANSSDITTTAGENMLFFRWDRVKSMKSCKNVILFMLATWWLVTHCAPASVDVFPLPESFWVIMDWLYPSVYFEVGLIVPRSPLGFLFSIYFLLHFMGVMFFLHKLAY